MTLRNFYVGLLTHKCCTTCNSSFLSDRASFKEEILVCTNPEKNIFTCQVLPSEGTRCSFYKKNVFLIQNKEKI